eukprot:gnl/Spiro4/4457_TR2220_c0_g1_i1.p3 gnl/Spiro4/4457_TR2220_c0_g1~~gnl/Spiro4/4457_TR2220_c0_g1_i1.p3  ORF type:complete len:113 (+),score=13.62 gnl/Spiro4/4457_TR2220_c0_g1_i1:213-551(+)
MKNDNKKIQDSNKGDLTQASPLQAPSLEQEMTSGQAAGSGEESEKLTPVEKLLRALVPVIEGAAFTSIPAIIYEIMPEDRNEAFEFLEKLRRLSLCGQRVLSTAQEIVVGRG